MCVCVCVCVCVFVCVCEQIYVTIRCCPFDCVVSNMPPSDNTQWVTWQWFKQTKSIFSLSPQEHELRAHPFLEIYDGNTIYFMAPLDKQRDFYVPESLQKFPGEEPYEYIYSEESVEATSEDGPPDEDGDESSLLHPSQVVKAAPLGTQEKEEEAKEAEAEPALAAPSGEDAEDQGTDEESTSSFEEVKMEGDEEKADQP